MKGYTTRKTRFFRKKGIKCYTITLRENKSKILRLNCSMPERVLRILDGYYEGLIEVDGGRCLIVGFRKKHMKVFLDNVEKRVCLIFHLV